MRKHAPIQHTGDDSPFAWAGQPSSFRKDHRFNGVNARNSMTATTNNDNMTPIDLPGSGAYAAPKGKFRDALVSGGKLGKK